MKTFPDKGISQINYNFLNLPQSIVQNSNSTYYTYRADGTKVSKAFTLNGATIDTDYLDGFVYTSTYTQQLEAALLADDLPTREAVSAGQEESMQLERKVVAVPNNPPSVAAAKPSFFPTAEGFYDYDNLKYIYQYKDHLGNVRLSYSKNATTGLIAIEDTNDYYPFGLSFINGGASNYSPSTMYKNWKMQGQELQESGFYAYKWRQYMPDVGRFFNVDPLATKYPYNSTYAFQENKLGMGVELEGLELLLNHTGFFAINGNEMQVKRAPTSQTTIGQDGNRYATFTAGDIGLSTSGYNPDGARISTGTTGLRQDSYKYNGPTADSAQMQDIPGSTSGQTFKTTRRGLEMTNNTIKDFKKGSNLADGLKELINLVNLAANIPDAMKSLTEYPQAVNDVKAVDFQATQMDQAIKAVDGSGINMTPQVRNDVVNYVNDGTLPNPGAGLMPNSLIIQNGTQIMKANGIQIQPLDQQLQTGNKTLPQ